MIEIIGLDDQKKWLDIIKQFKEHDIYYFPEYTKAFQIHGDGEPFLFYYKSENMKAINVLMKRDISTFGCFSEDLEKNAWFDIATPYGYGGFLIEGEKSKKSLEQLNYEYSAWCREHGIVSEFVRFHPLLKNHCGLDPVYELIELGPTVSLDLSSPETISSNMETKMLKNILKARGNGIKVFSGNTWGLYSEFKKMYDKTMDRDNANKYYYFSKSFYKSVMADLKENSVIFYATYNGEIIAMNLVLYCNQKMHSHLQCSKKEFMHLSPVSLMRYTSALWGYKNGLKTLHLGGGVGAQEDSLYRFKKKFNKNSDNLFTLGRKIFDNEKYLFLTGLRRKDPSFEQKPNFFPEYRS